ncbi:helix-turn-helix domain-containing protein [Halovenus sp. WSH3]|uniref:Helix-turn-helix domain-containing protein n=1 Tax=Halovenus carboxidivorans TaxID=2692199 RepID=A0A6B0T316_9EURY|nr:winged helix-turn-helix domain-containing protein [Halovenus carboxidivorans]MXR52415.1 helix-turn-helix domain-containing protein [Halovenus carboxidivorans]
MATQISVTDNPCGDDEDSDDPRSLLELLGDEYTQRVLFAVTDQAMSGNEVAETADVSKATAYRRLDDLEAAGLVESETVFDPDGHHHEQFYAVVETIDLAFGGGDVSVTVETEEDGDADRPSIPNRE